jgi:CheY-like chemotaxis protein
MAVAWIQARMVDTRTSLAPLVMVDDSVDDTFILSRLLRKAAIRHPIQISLSAEDAMRTLGRVKAGSDFPPPIAILTDLHMPGCDGFEFLRWVRAMPQLDRVFTVAVSTSELSRDVQRAYAAGCHAYLRKYPTAEQLVEIITAAHTFQLGLPVPLTPGLHLSDCAV